MCVQCVRRSKRLGIPKGKFGKIKFWANRAMRGGSWPLFRDNRLNYAIEAHIHRIEQARTRRPKHG